MGTLVDAALDYASRGYRVFPIWGVRPDGSCLCNATDCSAPGKHPLGRLVPNGLTDATTEADKIRAWWRQAPNANVGLCTGDHPECPHGLLVIDCDRKGDVDGVEAFRELWWRHTDEAPQTAIAKTGGGGEHVVLRYQKGLRIRNPQGLLVDGTRIAGIDVRGEGGYVVAPPSVHANGTVYEWEYDLDESDDLPNWLADHVVTLELAEVTTGSQQAAPIGQVPPAHVVSDEEVAWIRSALEVVPANEDRDSWVLKVSMPLHDHFKGNQQGYDLWHEWCKRGQGKTTPNGNAAYTGERECRIVWGSFGKKRNPKSILTLYAHAWQVHGWEPPAELREALAGEGPAPKSNGVHLGAPTQSGGDDDQVWRKPDKFRIGSVVPRIDFAAAWLPELNPLRDLVGAIARLQQVPVEFPMMLSLGMASAAYSGVYDIKLDRTGWSEPSPIWVICALPSGAGKSPVIRPLAKPFYEWEDQVDTSAHSSWMADVDVASLQLQVEMQTARTKLKKAAGDPEQMRQVKHTITEARRRLEELKNDIFPSPRLLASSMTTPALVEFMQHHRGRCLIIDSEGSVFQHALAGRTDIEKDLDPWLKAFSCERIVQHRIGSAKSGDRVVRKVDRPYLSMAVCTQLANMGIFRDPFAEGKGFIMRFLPLVAAAHRPTQAIVEGEIPDVPKQWWANNVKRLLGYEMPDNPYVINLSGSAREVFVDWMQGWLDGGDGEREFAQYDSPVGAKLRSYAMRLMLLFHVLGNDQPTDQISSTNARTVCEVWMPYLVDMVEHASGAVRSDVDGVIAERIVAWLRRNDRGGSTATRHEIYSNLKSRGTGAAVVTKYNDINGALALLTDAGWIRPVDKVKNRGAGTVPCAHRYDVHPELESHGAAILGEQS